MKFVPYLKSLTKINLERIKNSIIRHKRLKLLEEILGKKLLDLGLRNEFWEKPAGGPQDEPALAGRIGRDAGCKPTSCIKMGNW